MAVYRGDTYVDSTQIYESTLTVPFDLSYGNPGTLNWTLRATFGTDMIADGGTPLAEAVLTVDDLTTGVVSYTFEAADTAGIDVPSGVFDLEMENVSDTRFAVGRVFTVLTGTVHFRGDISRSATLSPSVLDDSEPSSDALTGLANLLSTGASTPSETEHGVYRDTVSGTAYLRPIMGTQGISATQEGESIRIKRRPKLFAPQSRSIQSWYRPIVCLGRRTAGSSDYSNALAAYPDSDSAYPWMLAHAIDVNEIPSNGHQWLANTDDPIGAGTGYNGYLSGHKIKGGDFRRGRKLVWDLIGSYQNTDNGVSDAGFEFSIDINPAMNDPLDEEYDQTRMMRFPFDVGAYYTSAGLKEMPFRAKLELVCLGEANYFASFEATLYSETDTGVFAAETVLQEYKMGFGHFIQSRGASFLSDWVAQVKWRVERDITAAGAELFGAACGATGYQGTNQGAEKLRLNIDHYRMDFVGF